MKLLIKLFTGFLILLIAFIFGVIAVTQGFLSFLIGGVEVQNIESVLSSIQNMSDLTTSRYSYSQTISVSRNVPSVVDIFYGETLEFQAIGHVTAGVDLGSLTDNDVQVINNQLIITLPDARLLDCFFSENDSRVISQQSAILANYPEDLQIMARRLAIEHFRDQSLEDGIIDNARLQAETSIEEFLRVTTGETYSNIDVIFAPTSPDQMMQYPETCLNN